jgi:hypothetical protein
MSMFRQSSCFCSIESIVSDKAIENQKHLDDVMKSYYITSRDSGTIIVT